VPHSLASVVRSGNSASRILRLGLTSSSGAALYLRWRAATRRRQYSAVQYSSQLKRCTACKEGRQCSAVQQSDQEMQCLHGRRNDSTQQCSSEMRLCGAAPQAPVAQHKHALLARCPRPPLSGSLSQRAPFALLLTPPGPSYPLTPPPHSAPSLLPQAPPLTPRR
jgi:hypothetical protein